MRKCIICGTAKIRQFRPKGLWVVECLCSTTNLISESSCSISEQAVIEKWEFRQDRLLDDMKQDMSKRRCDCNLNEIACEKCGDNRADEPCYFFSDGGYEPRDGTYLCSSCGLNLLAPFVRGNDERIS